MSQWHVLPCRPALELSIEKKIRSLGYGAMAPWYEGQKYIRGNRRKWRRPLYVGYVFVSFPDHAAGWQHVSGEMNTAERRIVFRLLGGDDPTALHQADVEYLHSIADGRYKDPARTFTVGDQVFVPNGHLQGLPSTIVRIKRGTKATLRVEIGKRDIHLERPLAILVKV